MEIFKILIVFVNIVTIRQFVAKIFVTHIMYKSQKYFFRFLIARLRATLLKKMLYMRLVKKEVKKWQNF